MMKCAHCKRSVLLQGVTLIDTVDESDTCEVGLPGMREPHVVECPSCSHYEDVARLTGAHASYNDVLFHCPCGCVFSPKQYYNESRNGWSEETVYHITNYPINRTTGSRYVLLSEKEQRLLEVMRDA